MKIISWNVNGIRSACRKGFTHWFGERDADIICLQEIKAGKEDLEKIFESDELYSRYTAYYSCAEKKGYSGVLILTKKVPISAEYTLGLPRFENEGRVVRLEYPEFILFALYMPHGGRIKENLPYKLEAYEYLLSELSAIKKPVILAGDFNIAHKENDLARPRDNTKNIMFTPEERKQLDKLVSLGFIDSFRKFNHEDGNYTWWPYRNGLRERNVGWRIDYVFASEPIGPDIKEAFILNGDQGSDHCPVGVEIDMA